MAKTKKWHHIDRAEFANLKKLQDAGLNPNQVAKLTGRGASTIAYVYKSPTLEEYKFGVSERRASAYAAKAAGVPSRPVGRPLKQEVEVEVPERESLDLEAERVFAILERIAVATERLADAWENAPNKKRLF